MSWNKLQTKTTKPPFAPDGHSAKREHVSSMEDLQKHFMPYCSPQHSPASSPATTPLGSPCVSPMPSPPSSPKPLSFSRPQRLDETTIILGEKKLVTNPVSYLQPAFLLRTTCPDATAGMLLRVVLSAREWLTCCCLQCKKRGGEPVLSAFNFRCASIQSSDDLLAEPDDVSRSP